jgi:hypothetical protein
METHGVSEKVAKRLPNVLMYGGGYETWLDSNDLTTPRAQWFQKVILLKRELLTFRAFLFTHPRFKEMVNAERERAKREMAEHSVEASLMSRIAQTCENEVLGIIDRVFFDLGWNTIALVFDGLIAEPRGSEAEPLEQCLRKAEAACHSRGWKVVLADKPLHHDGDFVLPRTLTEARQVVREMVAEGM